MFAWAAMAVTRLAQDSSKPTLWVFAGPNGAGKTSLLEEIHKGKYPYVNADEIAKKLTPASGMDPTLQAGRLAVVERNAHLAERNSLSIETTLTGKSGLAFMRKAKVAGYRIVLAYVGIDTPELSRLRIDYRVADGGHDVPEKAVQRRHPASLKNLAAALELADAALVYDNSDEERRLLLQREDDRATYLSADKPAWFLTAVPERFRNIG